MYPWTEGIFISYEDQINTRTLPIRRHKVKIETLPSLNENVVKLDNYFHPEELKDAIVEFVDYYSNNRYHESLNNVTPADVLAAKKSTERSLERIKMHQWEKRRQLFYNKSF